jgi:hypothetical protein
VCEFGIPAAARALHREAQMGEQAREQVSWISPEPDCP